MKTQNLFTVTTSQKDAIRKAVNAAQSSPWYGFAGYIKYDDLINEAMYIGSAEILEKIRKFDIKGYRMEEAQNGNI